MRTTSILVAFLILVFLQPKLNGEDVVIASRHGTLAEQYIAAHFANGYWAKQSENFLCPVSREVEQTKVAIFVKQTNDKTMHLAIALDRAMRKYPQLRRSFFIVSEEKKNESMTDEELALNLERLRALAKQHDVTKLSLAYLQHSSVATRWRNSLGFFEGADVVLAVIEPGILPPRQTGIQRNRLPTRTVKPYYRYFARFRDAEIDRGTAEFKIEQAIASLLD